MRTTITVLLCMGAMTLWANKKPKTSYWQQTVAYTMDVTLNDELHQLNGKTTLNYTNNSPDTLTELFFHLYFNAFQPGSEMDVRSNWIVDPDPRVGDRISKLKPEEIGYSHIKKLSVNRLDHAYIEEYGTLAKIKLTQPILPGKKACIEFEWQAQVPIQIRRSGRDNAEGVDYSMAQWYPKLCEYDAQGWHPNPYVGREFYGVWGSFDVTLHVPHHLVVAGTAVPVKTGTDKQELSVWHAKAENVHDFMWAADQHYTHEIVKGDHLPDLHFYYISDSLTQANWNKLEEFMPKIFQYMNEHFGTYPYSTFSVIQGGDGGMEYPMATLITGRRKVGSLVGVTAHELAHSWYQGILGFNESLYGWMDEGFTSFSSDEVMNSLFPKPKVPVHLDAVGGYIELALSGKEENMNTHADHYNTNYAYGSAVYNKGQAYLYQLKYILGEDLFYRSMKRFFREWQFKHPKPEDLLHIMELESGITLDWYNEYFVNTTKTIDYAVDTVLTSGEKHQIVLQRIGSMPMPLDLSIEFEDNSVSYFKIPLDLMNGMPSLSAIKDTEGNEFKFNILMMWPWVNPQFELSLQTPQRIKQVVIDPFRRTADVNRENNTFTFQNQTGTP